MNARDRAVIISAIHHRIDPLLSQLPRPEIPVLFRARTGLRLAKGRRSDPDPVEVRQRL